MAGYVNETGLASPTGTVSFLDTSNGNSVLGTAALGTGASALGWLNSQTPATGGDPCSVVVGDFNGDGIPDLAVANRAHLRLQYTVTILLGNGDGTFTRPPRARRTGAYPSSIAVGDFNGDGIPDLAVADYDLRHANDSAGQRGRNLYGDRGEPGDGQRSRFRGGRGLQRGRDRGLGRGERLRATR